MNYKLRTDKAFTLIELVVAIALLAMVLGFSSVIFKVSIGAYRTAGANAEVMQKLRAITDQLNTDFKGIRKDAPMAIQFKKVNGIRRDSIAFFSNGDFQSVRQYWYKKSSEDLALKTVSGNVASIYYGQASDPNILARRQKILTSDTTLIDTPSLGDPNEFVKDSLAEWKVPPPPYVFYFLSWVSFPPHVDPGLEEDLPMYVVNGITNFMIQCAEPNEVSGTFVWRPESSDDFIPPWDANPTYGVFGFYFNIPGGVGTDWHDRSDSRPRALKFTFTLYDSKGIFKNGRTFTHIVYLD